MRFFAGLDLGQSQDYTALTIVERAREEPWEERAYQVRHLQRWRLGTPYTELVARVAALLRRPPLPGDTALVIDATGVGAAVCDLFRQLPLDAERVEVQLTSGHYAATRDEVRWRVPKKDVVSALAVLLQEGKLRIASALPDASALVAELQDFRVRVSDTGNVQFGAGGDRHDDLVLAVALACWYAETVSRPGSGLAYFGGEIVDLNTGLVVRSWDVGAD